MNILITGGNGYIAKSLTGALSKEHNITCISRSDFYLTDYNATCEWFHSKQYDVVIHTAICGGSRLQTDNSSVYETNTKMFNNLIANKHCFFKLITFGSGAELFHGDTPYANSKREIAKQILNIPNFYNLRIFATFDEYEWNTRFIKANILRYIKKEPMIVHTDKIMDFFYMKDLVHLVNHYITENNLSQTINCSYSQKYTLTNIAEIINNLDKHKVPIIIENKNKLEFYCGESHNMPIKTIGLETGIYNTYNKLSSGDLINA